MQVGVVGKANVGKSTFFKALTMAEVLIANYPFATIEPNKGFAFVRVECVDRDFGVQCNPRFGHCVNGTRFVPVEVMDVAGLVPGAHLGKGMGNQFLDDLRQAHALIHVVDMAGTTNEKGEPIEPGTYDPAFDVKFLEVELDYWYLAILKKGWDKLARNLQHEHKEIAKALATQLSALGVTEAMVGDAIKQLSLSGDATAWTEEQMLQMSTILRKKTKPMLIVANKMDIPTAKANLERVRKQFPDYIFVPCSSESELALKEASRKGLIEYLPGGKDFKPTGQMQPAQENALRFIKENVLDAFGSTGIQQAIDTAVFELLKYIAVFPGGVTKLADQFGNVLPDCFLLPSGSTALDFAAKIHTDLAKNFVAAIDVKTKRKVGRDHILKHRDVIEILTSK
ncbi:MAG: redox-regulated ATPase YchF [Candidatus Woesearchaeota archaeon]